MVIPYLAPRRFGLFLVSILMFALGVVAVSRAQEAPTPRVWSIVPDSPVPTTATVRYTVTFSEAVTGVDVSDFSTAGDDAGAHIQTVSVASNPAVYEVVVSLGAAHAKLLLVLNDDDTIRNKDDVPLGGNGASNGVVSALAVRYHAFPQVVSLVPESTLPTTSMATFVVTFSQAVTGVDVSDFGTAGDDVGALVKRVSATDNPAVYDVVVALGPTHKQLLLLLNDDDTIRNVAGAPLAGSGMSNGTVSAVGVTYTAPTTVAPPADVSLPQSAGAEVGQHSSLALTKPTNLPVISYYDAINTDLKLMFCTDLQCGTPTIRIVDSVGDVGEYSSLALTATNIPVIAYHDKTNQNLKLAICNNATCTAPVIRTLDSVGNVGTYTSLSLTATNLPVISYYDDTNDDLKLALCTNATCSTSLLRTIDSTGDVGAFSAIAMPSTNMPVMVYFDNTNDDLKYAVCNNPTCSASTIATLDTLGSTGWFPSITLTSTNQPVISYQDYDGNDLQLITCRHILCNERTYVLVDDTDVTGGYTSTALTASNVPVIAYYEFTNRNLKLALCNNAQCDAPVIRTLDSVGDVGAYPALKVIPSTNPTLVNLVISYQDGTIDGLKSLKLYAGTQAIDTVQSIDKGQPYAFNKVSPVNNATGIPTTVTFKWAPSTYATTYEICVSLSAATCTNWGVLPNADTQLVYSGLSPNTTYYWHVRALNAGGRTYSAGEYWSFKTGP
jgi:hypothetical protein